LVTIDATFPMFEIETCGPVCPDATGDFCVLEIIGIAVELGCESVATATILN